MSLEKQYLNQDSVKYGDMFNKTSNNPIQRASGQKARANINCSECLSFSIPCPFYSTMGLYWLLSPVCAFLISLATPRVIAIHLQPTPRQVNSPFKPGFERQAVSSHGRLPPGALIDTCASIDIGLVAELGPLIGLEILDGVLTESRLCLCVTVSETISSS